MPSAKTWPHYVAPTAFFCGGICIGMMLGWSNPILEDLKNAAMVGIDLDTIDASIIISMVPLAASFSTVPSALLMRKIGSKWMTVLSAVSMIFGWVLLPWACANYMYYFGRFFMGWGAGMLTVGAPSYLWEILGKDHYTWIVVILPVSILVGVLLVCLLGYALRMFEYHIACLVAPIIFFIFMMVLPESPHATFQRKNTKQTEKILRLIKGKNYDTEAGMVKIEEKLKYQKKALSTFRGTLTQRQTQKNVAIIFFLMIFEQSTGIVCFFCYSTKILEGSFEDWDVSLEITLVFFTCIILATTFICYNFRKYQRKTLMIISSINVAIGLLIMAGYLTYFERICEKNTKYLHGLESLLVFAMCYLGIGYSIGFAPVPWVICTELLQEKIKQTVTLIALSITWFVAFLYTIMMLPIAEQIGFDVGLYIWAVFIIASAFFFGFKMPETNPTKAEEEEED